MSPWVPLLITWGCIIVGVWGWHYRAWFYAVARLGGRIVRDERIPRGARVLAAFVVLPIPGPVDEVAAVMLVSYLWICHRDLIRHHWKEVKP